MITLSPCDDDASIEGEGATKSEGGSADASAARIDDGAERSVLDALRRSSKGRIVYGAARLPLSTLSAAGPKDIAPTQLPRELQAPAEYENLVRSPSHGSDETPVALSQQLTAADSRSLLGELQENEANGQSVLSEPCRSSPPVKRLLPNVSSDAPEAAPSPSTLLRLPGSEARNDAEGLSPRISAAAVLYAILRENDGECSRAARAYTKELAKSMMHNDARLAEAAAKERAARASSRELDEQRRQAELRKAELSWEQEYTRRCQEAKQQEESSRRSVQRAAQVQQQSAAAAAAAADRHRKAAVAAAAAAAEEESGRQRAKAMEMQQKAAAATAAAAVAAAAAEQQKQQQLMAERERQMKLRAEQERASAAQRATMPAAASTVAPTDVGGRSPAGTISTRPSTTSLEGQRSVESERAAAIDSLLQHVIACRTQVGQLASQLLGAPAAASSPATSDSSSGGGGVGSGAGSRPVSHSDTAALMGELQMFDQLLGDCVAARSAGKPGVVGMLHTASEKVKALRDIIAQELGLSRRTSADRTAERTASTKDAGLVRSTSVEGPLTSERLSDQLPSAPHQQQPRMPTASAQAPLSLAASADESDETPSMPAPTGLDPSIWAKHCRFQRVLLQTKEAAAELRSNAQLKKLRMDIQMLINTTVNAISDASSSHMRDKLDRLLKLLSGERVPVVAGGARFVSVKEHPAAAPFSKDLLAAKFVEQGRTQVKSKHESAFAFAAVAAAVMRRHADFGELLLAHFAAACPHVVPRFDVPLPSSAASAGHGSAAARPASGGGKDAGEDGKLAEEQHDLLASARGYVRLFFATFVVSLGDVSRAWTWLAAAMRLPPAPCYTATAVADMLDVTGYLLQQTYGSQFNKLLRALTEGYLPRVRAADAGVPGAGGPTSRLEQLLRDSAGRARWQQPAGVLPPSLRLG